MHVGTISAEKLYEDDPKLLPEDVNIFREWLTKQPHMPELHEIQPMIFLQGCGHSVEAAKVAIDAYFTRRTLYPELFRCPSDDALRKALSVMMTLALPRRTPQGRDIFLTHLIDPKPENFNFVLEVAVINMIAALHVHQNGCPGGVVIVLDFSGSTLAHLTRVNLLALKRYFDHLQEGVPVRIQGVHLINSIPFMDTVIAVVKPLLHNQLFALIQVHSSLDTFHKYIPKECLPEDYGGELPTLQILHEKTVTKIFDHLGFFKWHEEQTINESKRMKKSQIIDSDFGVEGTFKKLAID